MDADEGLVCVIFYLLAISSNAIASMFLLWPQASGSCLQSFCLLLIAPRIPFVGPMSLPKAERADRIKGKKPPSIIFFFALFFPF